MARTRRNKKSVKVDFTGVESSGRVQEGRQLATVEECELRSSDSGNEYFNWKMKTDTGICYHTTSLQPQALWNLRNVMEALGYEVPDGPMDLDPADFVGGELGIEVEKEEYQGKSRPTIVDVFPVDELEESTPKADEEAEEAEVTYEDVMEMDKDELLGFAEESGVKVPAVKRRKLEALREYIADKLELAPVPEGEPELPTYDQIMECEKAELLKIAEEFEVKVPAAKKRKVDTLRDFLVEELEIEEPEEEPEEEPAPRSRRRSGSKTLKKGSVVEFEDDGDTLSGKVLSVNEGEGFAVINVDGEEWEVELNDIKVK